MTKEIILILVTAFITLLVTLFFKVYSDSINKNKEQIKFIFYLLPMIVLFSLQVTDVYFELGYVLYYFLASCLYMAISWIQYTIYIVNWRSKTTKRIEELEKQLKQKEHIN